MSARKACPRRATRRYLNRARHRAMGRTRRWVGAVANLQRSFSLTEAEMGQFATALQGLVVTADLAPAFARKTSLGVEDR